MFLLLGIAGMPLNLDGELNLISEWFNDAAKLWSDKQIDGTENETSLSHLFDQGIVKLDAPIGTALAMNAAISDEQRAHSFTVNVKSGHYDLDETYFSFVQFFNANDAAGEPRGVLAGIPTSPEFILGSLPSNDKKGLYEYVEKTLAPGAQLERLKIDFEISVIAGNGQTIQTWMYNDCTLLDYVVFLNSNKDEFRWSSVNDSEIREIFAFQCLGLDIVS